jgi:hypothetical protein
MAALRLHSPCREAGLRMERLKIGMLRIRRSHFKGLPHCKPKKDHDGQVAEDENRARGTGLG